MRGGWMAAAGAAFATAFLVTCGALPGADGDGGDPSPVDGLDRSAYRSGSRIKVRVLEGADGSRSLSGLFDSELDVPCFAIAFAGPTIRCVPVTIGGEGYWSDPACNTPLLALSTTYANPKFATMVVAGAYGRVRRVGAAHGGAVHWKSGEQCVEVPPAQRATLNFFAAGGEVPAQSFVAFETREI